MKKLTKILMRVSEQKMDIEKAEKKINKLFNPPVRICNACGRIKPKIGNCNCW